LPPGAYTVRVLASGTCVTKKSVTVAGSTFLPVVVNRSCMDKIVTAVPSIALVRGRAQVLGTDKCLDDKALQGTGTTSLANNMLAPAGTPSCHSEVGVITRDHGFWFSNDVSAMPWTDATGDALTVTLPDVLPVPTRIFVLSAGNAASIPDKMAEI